jgi:hypothetical protein
MPSRQAYVASPHFSVGSIWGCGEYRSTVRRHYPRKPYACQPVDMAQPVHQVKSSQDIEQLGHAYDQECLIRGYMQPYLPRSVKRNPVSQRIALPPRTREWLRSVYWTDGRHAVVSILEDLGYLDAEDPRWGSLRQSTLDAWMEYIVTGKAH